MLFRSMLLTALTLLVACDPPPSRPEVKESSAVARPEPAADSDARPLIVFVTGDEEYRSEESMPMLAAILERDHGVDTHVAYALAEDGSIDPERLDHIDGLDRIEDADLVVMFTRFRQLPDEQLAHIVDWVAAGKPIVGFRTSTHAFRYPDGHPRAAEMNDAWPVRVFGQKWITHHGHFDDGARPLTEVALIEGRGDHPVLRGVEPFDAFSWLYHVEGGGDRLHGNCAPLLYGRALQSSHEGRFDRFPPTNPVAWTKTNRGDTGGEGRCFFTTLGHPYDFREASMRRLALQGILWALGREGEIPAGGVETDLPRAYVPSNSGFGGKFRKGVYPRLGPRGSPARFDTGEGEVIAILGNTFAERMTHFPYFEATLHACRAEAKARVRNLGWSGDEVVRAEVVPFSELAGGPRFRYWQGDEFNVSVRPFGFPSRDELLHRVGADTIFLCYGFGESFAGDEGLEEFRESLRHEVRELRSRSYNGGVSTPQLVLVTPTAQEVLPRAPDPEGVARRNRELAAYARAIRDVGAGEGVFVVDLHGVTSRAGVPLTVNGVHLSDAGYRFVAREMIVQLGISEKPPRPSAELVALVTEKNRLFFNRWRPMNQCYALGTRVKPFGVEDFPPRMNELDAAIGEVERDIHGGSR